MLQIIVEAQVGENAAEEAKRILAMSEAERQARAQKVEHEKTVAVENAQKRMQQAEASVAGVTGEAQWRLAQKENERLSIQRMAEQL
eukprot:4152240-Pyramimonas_sp.AAC.1